VIVQTNDGVYKERKNLAVAQYLLQYILDYYRPVQSIKKIICHYASTHIVKEGRKMSLHFVHNLQKH